MDDPPRATTQGDDLFALSRSRAARTRGHQFVHLIRGPRCDGLHAPTANSITFLRYEVRDQQHRSLVVGPSSRRDPLQISLRRLELAEEPIDGPEARNAFDRLATALRSPLIK